MTAYFVDSSALLKKYRSEIGSQRVIDLLDAARQIIISRLTVLEVPAALVRRGKVAGMLPASVLAALDVLNRNAQNSSQVAELDDVVIDRATLLTRRHGLRAADAIQLASALFASEEVAPVVLTFLACDRELNTAAASEGLLVVDPTLP